MNAVRLPIAFRIALKLDEIVAMKFLVVDDHELIREAMRGALAELDGDASILEASDSRETMRLIEEHPDVDLILLDLNLPDRDGFTVKRRTPPASAGQEGKSPARGQLAEPAPWERPKRR